MAGITHAGDAGTADAEWTDPGFLYKQNSGEYTFTAMPDLTAYCQNDAALAAWPANASDALEVIEAFVQPSP
jgi:hypothetical protein